MQTFCDFSSVVINGSPPASCAVIKPFTCATLRNSKRENNFGESLSLHDGRYWPRWDFCLTCLHHKWVKCPSNLHFCSISKFSLMFSYTFCVKGIWGKERGLHLDCILSNLTVECCSINFSCLSQIRRENFCFASKDSLLYYFARLQLFRCHVWQTFPSATPYFLFKPHCLCSQLVEKRVFFRTLMGNHLQRYQERKKL